jgi:hypothetical protein
METKVFSGECAAVNRYRISQDAGGLALYCERRKAARDKELLVYPLISWPLAVEEEFMGSGYSRRWFVSRLGLLGCAVPLTLLE